MDFPITPEAFGTLIGAAFAAGLLTQWLKRYLDDWRYTPIVVLGLSIAIQLAATMAAGDYDWWRAGALGVLGASIATFGYEVIANLLGVVGVGQRA